LLDLAVLGLLREQPLHGYELKKRLGETLGFLWGVSYGSLYPALKRLERDGAVAVVATDGAATSPPPPPTGSLAGDLASARVRRQPRASRRTRKAYRITDTGGALFERLLADDTGSDDDRAFALRLSLCRFLPAERRLELLEHRRAQLADRLARARRPRSSGRTTDRYARSLREHRTSTTEHDLDWIDELIAAERNDLAERPEGATA